MHLRLTAKPHLCVICSTLHTQVNTHLLLWSTHNLLIKRYKELNLCIQVEHFSPCDRNDDISISGSEAPPTFIICQGEWHGKIKRNEEFTAF